jgi:hypothetical protein
MHWNSGYGHVVLDLPKSEYRWVMEQVREPGDIITELARALDNTGGGKAISHPLADFGHFRPGWSEPCCRPRVRSRHC